MYLPSFSLECYLNYLESSSSIAPAPGTIASAFIALLTIIIASFKDLSAS